MKIRYGFVSNSSSSSFTCDVCGNTESGYDASPEDCGMKRCKNDHTFCESDLVKGSPSIEEQRKMLIDNISSYWKDAERQAKVDSFNALDVEGVEEAFEEADNEDGVWPCHCPICSFTEISLDERDTYLLRKTGKTWKEIEDQIRSEFPNYKAFKDYVYPPKS